MVHWKNSHRCTHADTHTVYLYTYRENQLPGASIQQGFQALHSCFTSYYCPNGLPLFAVLSLSLSLTPSIPHCPALHRFSSSQSKGKASPSEGEEQRFEARMWASCCNKKLICLLAHYCGLWLPGPYKWKSNVALHYPFGIQLRAQADTECLKDPFLQPPPYMHVSRAQVCISMWCMCVSLMYTEKWWKYVCMLRYGPHGRGSCEW